MELMKAKVRKRKLGDLAGWHGEWRFRDSDGVLVTATAVGPWGFVMDFLERSMKGADHGS